MAILIHMPHGLGKFSTACFLLLHEAKMPSKQSF